MVNREVFMEENMIMAKEMEKKEVVRVDMHSKLIPSDQKRIEKLFFFFL